MCLAFGVGVVDVKDIQSKKYKYLQKYDIFQMIHENLWNRSSNKKLDFSVKSVLKKVITRATPGRSLVIYIVFADILWENLEIWDR